MSIPVPPLPAPATAREQIIPDLLDALVTAHNRAIDNGEMPDTITAIAYISEAIAEKFDYEWVRIQ